MNPKRMATAAVALILILSSWQVANKYCMVSAVLPTQATVTQKVSLLFRKRNYQVAIPDRSILEEVRFSIVPKARACGGGGGGSDCDSTGEKAVCPIGCPTGYCWCGPGLLQSSCSMVAGCAPHYCQTTTNGRLTKLCAPAYNTDTTDCGPTCKDDNANTGCTVVMKCNGGQCP